MFVIRALAAFLASCLILLAQGQEAELVNLEGEGRWMFFAIPLGEGRHRIHYEIKNAGDTGASLSAWVLTNFLLEGKALKVARPDRVAGPDERLAALSGEDYRTIELFSRKAVLTQLPAKSQ